MTSWLRSGKARAVWIGGGRQWRLVDAYLNTRTLVEMRALLDRGGVIGGSSAGASIMASYLVRGAREGNSTMMARGYEEGFGFLHDVAIDQHLLRRERENDMVAVVTAHPALLGIGIDEKTAVVVQGDRFEVVGPSKVAIYETRKTLLFPFGRRPLRHEGPYSRPMTRMSPLIEFKNVTVYRGEKIALDGITLSIAEGEHVAILGPNGCGKSTLIKTITRELYPRASENGSGLRIFGQDRWNIFDLRPLLGIVSNDLMQTCTRDISGREAVLSGFFGSIGIWPNHHVTEAMEKRTDEILSLLEVRASGRSQRR